MKTGEKGGIRLVLGIWEKYILKFLKRVNRMLKTIYLYCSSDILKLKKEQNPKKIILIDTPTHGNLGDQAIALAQINFLENEIKDIPVFEFTQREYVYIGRYIRKNMKENDILLIHGGGFIGTVWEYEEDIFIRLLTEFKEHKIVIFPQTVHFENSKRGKLELERVKQTINSCSQLTVFLREKRSYDLMSTVVCGEKQSCVLVPDIVTYLTPEIKVKKENNILLCFRNDVEKVICSQDLNRILKEIENLGYRNIYTDMVLPCTISKEDRQKQVYHKLTEFASAKLVITDRLHGMLFAAITGTPCIAFDNSTKKVSGVYDWIRDLHYIEYTDAKKLNIGLIQQMLEMKECVYDNKSFLKYYELIKDAIME